MFCLPVLYTENREKDGKTMHMRHIPVFLTHHHTCSVSIEYHCNDSLFENLLLSHAPRNQQNVVDSECTRFKDSSYLSKRIDTEKEQYHSF